MGKMQHHDIDNYGFCRNCGRLLPSSSWCQGQRSDHSVWYVMLALAVLMVIVLLTVRHNQPYEPSGYGVGANSEGRVVW
jgi:hypothetical protein